MIYVLIFLIIFAIILFNFILKNYKFKMDNFTFFEGSLGSGKTTIMTHFAVKEWKKRKIKNFLIKVFYIPITIIIYLIPGLNIIWVLNQVKLKKFNLFKTRGLEIYSTYPIRYRFTPFNKYSYSKVIDNRLFNWLIKVNEDCIIVLDELGYFYPPTENEKGTIKRTPDNEIFGLTWLRHAVSPYVLSASQDIGEVNISYRRKINHIYRLSNNTRVFLFLSKVSVIEIQRSEDSGSIITTFRDTSMEHINNWYFYVYPKNNFASRYGKNLYLLNDDELLKVSQDYDYLLKKMDLTPLDNWNKNIESLYYTINE